MIYFDNAATNGFKISAVTDATISTLKFLSANPGRSGHRLSLKGAELVYKARCIIAEAFGAPSPNHVIFTSNCTDALNKAIFGTLKKGDHVITTIYEHNSVLRPLFHLKESKIIDLTIVSPKNGSIRDEIIGNLRDNTALVAITGASNVTGEQPNWRDLTDTLRTKNVHLLIDGAQSGGHVPIDVVKDKISLLCLAGHKGLNGIAGSGILIIGENVEVSPIIFGGTGTETFLLTQPTALPERLESGTLNLPAIVALGEGVSYTSKNIVRFGKILLQTTDYLIRALHKVGGVTVYSKPNEFGIVSFNMCGYDSEELAYILNEKFDIAVRGGYHCAPLMHEFLGTKDGGAVRISLSTHNTVREIDAFIYAINTL